MEETENEDPEFPEKILDTPLLSFAEDNQISTWTIRHAVEGVQIFGGIGSGKTSGSGRALILKYLKNKFGGLVLTVKPNEKNDWIEYCAEANRADDLIIVEPGGENKFNFLDYESSNARQGITYTENIVQVLKTVIRASEERSGGKSDDQFWETALDMLIYNVIDLCLLAYRTVSVQSMYDIVLHAPKKDDAEKKRETILFQNALYAARENVGKQVSDWTKSFSPDERIKYQDEAIFTKDLLEKFADARTFSFVEQFFKDTYLNIGEKTRSIIEFTFTGFLFRLLKEPVYSVFCQHSSTFTPEDSINGKIILLNFPVKLYHKVGRDIQIMFKYIWQRAMEKRDVKEKGRPLFLIADEAQNFLHEHDVESQATARSSRIATLYISQNLPNYHANMGGDKSEYRVKSFLGTLATKIFHANADIETNKYASDLIGEAWVIDESSSTTMSGSFSATQGKSVKLEKIMRPEKFVQLLTGGPPNDDVITGVIHIQGKPFPSGLNHKEIRFKQKRKKHKKP